MTADRTDTGSAAGSRGAKGASAGGPSREDRRKAALKANMARRKEQARLRAAQQQDGNDADARGPDADG